MSKTNKKLSQIATTNVLEMNGDDVLSLRSFTNPVDAETVFKKILVENMDVDDVDLQSYLNNGKYSNAYYTVFLIHSTV
jgi:hypothetical protein